MGEKTDTTARLVEYYGVSESAGIITSPGKFEGESVQVLYWWESYLNGDGEPLYDGNSDDVCAVEFHIFPEDREVISIPDDARYALLETSGDGFVHLSYQRDSSL